MWVGRVNRLGGGGDDNDESCVVSVWAGGRGSGRKTGKRWGGGGNDDGKGR